MNERLKGEQEPVAWVYINEDGECEQIEYGSEGCDDPCVTPLYTAPPRKPWIGLSETEIRGCTCECVDNGTFTMACAIDFARALETTLKDRNTTN